VDDVIGDAPDPRRPRRPARWPVLSGVRVRRGRRALAGLAVLAAIAGVVTIGRAGLDEGATPGAAVPPATRPVQGTLLQLVAGQDTMYALVEDCADPEPCEVALLGSSTDGRTWREVPLPGRRPRPAVAGGWTLEVSGPEDQLSVEEPAAGVVHVGTTSFVTREVVDGRPLARVPAGRESLTRLCRAPRCATPTLEYLEIRTGVRSRLATQPPFPPTVLAVEGPQLWVAGIDPRTRRYAVAVSTDDGGRWRSVPLPQVPVGRDLVPRLVPAPEQNVAYLTLETPTGGEGTSVSDLWSVPDPETDVAPRRLLPQDQLLSGSAVGLRDGRLALPEGVVVALDGVVDRTTVEDPATIVVPWAKLQRGPHSLVVAQSRPYQERPSQIRLVVSATGGPDDWELRPVTLPR
jgi:hypothetical protein